MYNHICNQYGCYNLALSGYCLVHSPIPTSNISQETKKFIDHVLDNSSDDCVLWPFGRGGGGYGMISINGKHVGAHRYIKIISLLRKGRVPKKLDSLLCLHTPVICHNRLCVNPRHLRLGTSVDNSNDRYADGTGGVKLNSEQAISIYTATDTTRNLATRFDVDILTIREIRNGTTWGYITKGYQGGRTLKPNLSSVDRNTILSIFNADGSNEYISAMYDISPAIVGNIKTGRTGAHITKKKFMPGSTRKVNPEQVMVIYTSEQPQKEIAEIFHIDGSTVSNIKSGKLYSSITNHRRVV